MECRRQETFIKALFAAYFDGDVLGLVDGVQKIPADKRFKPFDVRASLHLLECCTLMGDTGCCA